MISLLHVYRGLAALLVVITHCAGLSAIYFSQKHSFINLSCLGHAAITFFFALSGFIIYHVHKKEIGVKGKFVDYLKKRIIRIYPIYLIVTFMFLPFYLLVPTLGKPYHKEFWPLVMSIFLIPQQHPPYVEVGWSLTHEVFFYLLLSVLIYYRKYGKPLFAILFVLTIYRIASGDGLHFPLSFVLSQFNLCFGLGLLAKYLIDKYNAHESRNSVLLFISGNVLFIVTCTLGLCGAMGAYELLGMYDVQNLKYTSIFGIASFLIILQSGNKRIEAFMGKRKFLLLLGNASYSIYLLHAFVINFLCKIPAYFGFNSIVPPFLAFVILSVTSLVSGIIFHLVVEIPLLRFFRNIWMRKNYNSKSTSS